MEVSTYRQSTCREAACLSLREKIKQIQKDLDDGIDTIGKKMTVCQLYEKYTRQRGNVRKGTQKSRQQLMKLLSEDKLGAASIDSVKLSDAKEWPCVCRKRALPTTPSATASVP